MDAGTALAFLAIAAFAAFVGFKFGHTKGVEKGRKLGPRKPSTGGGRPNEPRQNLD